MFAYQANTGMRTRSEQRGGEFIHTALGQLEQEGH